MAGHPQGGDHAVAAERMGADVVWASDARGRMHTVGGAEMATLDNVRRVFGQGCVLGVELEVEGEAGYSSNAAREIVMRLRPRSIQARPLGNVVYLMCAPTTSKEKCDHLLQALVDELSR